MIEALKYETASCLKCADILTLPFSLFFADMGCHLGGTPLVTFSDSLFTSSVEIEGRILNLCSWLLGLKVTSRQHGRVLRVSYQNK